MDFQSNTLLEYIKSDDRATIVLERSSAANTGDRIWRVIYQNTAMDWLVNMLDDGPQALQMWLKRTFACLSSLQKQTLPLITFAGHKWCLTTLQCGWDVLKCRDPEIGQLEALLGRERLLRVKAEKNEESFRRLSRSSPSGMFVISSALRPLYANDAYLELLGLDEEKWLATPEGENAWADVFVDGQEVERILGGLRHGIPKALFMLEVNRTSNGLPVWVEGTVFCDFDEDNNIVSIQGWLMDVSHRVHAETVKTERLQEALISKNATANFLDMISHEIRNPLSSIMLLAQDITDFCSTPDQATTSPSSGELDTILDAAKTISLCARHQKAIVDGVLELSRMDSGLLNLAFERVQPSSIVQETLKMVRSDAVAADIQMSFTALKSYHDLVPDLVLVDPARVSQIVVNLVQNAIKFTKKSAVRQIDIFLGASKTKPEPDDSVEFIPGPTKPHSILESILSANRNHSSDLNAEDRIYVYLKVKDSGCGLSKPELARLFERFSQASPKTFTQYGGSGMGLFISRKLVELHGGQIGVTSVAGEGSTFMFYVEAYRCTVGAQESSLVNGDSFTMPLRSKALVQAIASPAGSAPIQDLAILGKFFTEARDSYADWWS